MVAAPLKPGRPEGSRDISSVPAIQADGDTHHYLFHIISSSLPLHPMNPLDGPHSKQGLFGIHLQPSMEKGLGILVPIRPGCFEVCQKKMILVKLGQYLGLFENIGLLQSDSHKPVS